MRQCELLDLGRLEWMKAFRIQQQFVEEKKREGGIDRFLFVEHPHVVTLGRNAKEGQVLASPEILERSGIAFEETDRGGGATYHGPGQVVGYPILDLREWKRDVRAYFRGVEQFLIDALASLGVEAERLWSAVMRASGWAARKLRQSGFTLAAGLLRTGLH